LDLPDPFDLESFCQTLARRRHRPIVLQPIAIQAGLGGFWAATERADYILYQAGTSALHRLQIILHELSHLICDHTPTSVREAEFLQILLPDLSPRAIRHILKRAAYSTAEDQEAEMLATLILARVTYPSPAREASDRTAQADLIDRLVHSLGDSGETST
jgi:hypothetical protein